MVEEIEKYAYVEFQYLLLTGNYEKCLGYIKEILNKGIDIKHVYDAVIKKSLYAIGEMWEANKITVSAEHLASAIVDTILSEVYLKVITRNKINKTVILACTENEFHQIGIKMVSDVFEMNGWNTHFLGVDTTSLDIISTIKEVEPDLLALSLSLPFNLPVLEKMLHKIRAQFPELYILVGGQAFLHLGAEVLGKFKNIIYKPDLGSLEEFLKFPI